MIEVLIMTVRFVSAWLVAFCAVGGSARAQDTGTDDVQQGHRLATLVCSACHVAAADQPFEPILRPPAPSFESIARRGSITSDSVQAFLTTTHRDVGNPQGMPNPQLLDYQVKQLAAYLLSLRSHS
jgi:mono/diheme cytochrome c family protein